MSPGAVLSVPNGELRLVEDVPAPSPSLSPNRSGSALADSTGEQRLFRLVLSGGATAAPCYEQLAATGRARLGLASSASSATSAACRPTTTTPTSA